MKVCLADFRSVLFKVCLLYKMLRKESEKLSTYVNVNELLRKFNHENITQPEATTNDNEFLKTLEENEFTACDINEVIEEILQIEETNDNADSTSVQSNDYRDLQKTDIQLI